MRSGRARAPNMSPAELARLARNAVEAVDGGFAAAVRGAVVADVVDGRTRTMLHLHGQLPDVMGAKVEATIKRMTEQAKPAQGSGVGQLRAPGRGCTGRDVRRGRGRGADRDADVGGAAVVGGRGARATVRRRSRASRSPTPWSSSCAANASIEPVLVDDDGVPVAIGKRTSAPVTEDGPGGPAARRALPLRELRRPLRACRSITCDPGPGVGPTIRRTSPRCASRGHHQH